MITELYVIGAESIDAGQHCSSFSACQSSNPACMQ
jgi:hypothetical protein